jgi:hypothetical protein
MRYRLRMHHLYVILVAVLLAMLNARATDEIDEINTTDTNSVTNVTQETGDSDATNATEHMIGVYYANFADSAERRLSSSGLAKPEIGDTVDAVAKGFAECIVTSLQKSNNDETTFAIKLIAEGAAMDDVSLYMDSLSDSDSADPLAVFEVESRSCVESLDASYGLR